MGSERVKMLMFEYMPQSHKTVSRWTTDRICMGDSDPMQDLGNYHNYEPKMVQIILMNFELKRVCFVRTTITARLMTFLESLNHLADEQYLL